MTSEMTSDWYELAEQLRVLRDLAVRGILDYDKATEAVKELLKIYGGQ